MRVRAGVALGLAALVAGLAPAAWGVGEPEAGGAVPAPPPMAGTLIDIARAYATGLPTVAGVAEENGVVLATMRAVPDLLTRERWEADLLVSAIGRQLGANQGVPGLVADWNGLVCQPAPPIEGGCGDVEPFGWPVGSQQPVPQTARTDSELIAGIQSGARALGLQGISVDILSLGELRAVAIEATARSPRRFVERWRGDLDSLFGGPEPALFGLYVSLRDLGGAPFVRIHRTFDRGGGDYYREDVPQYQLRSPPGPAGYDLTAISVTDAASGRSHTWAVDSRARAERQAFTVARAIVRTYRHPQPEQPVSCADGMRVRLVYQDTSIEYGPCALPADIRRAVDTLPRVTRLAGCASPSSTIATRAGRAVALGPFRLRGLLDRDGATVRLGPAGYRYLPLQETRRVTRWPWLFAWPCAAGQEVYSDLAEPIGDAPGRLLVNARGAPGLVRLYLANPDGRFLGTAVLRVVATGRP